MGNCSGKQSKKSAGKDGIATPPKLIDVVHCRPVYRLYAPASCPWTLWLRISLSYKPISFQFFPSHASVAAAAGARSAVLECGLETVSGPHEIILRYVDGKYPDPPLLDSEGPVQPAVEKAAALQHRSMRRQLERLVKWAEELAAVGLDAKRPAAAGSTPRMEMRKFGRSYAQLRELMMEHAQAEERLIFPVIDMADRGLCSKAREEHGRELPLMNGIKEDIKSIGVLDPCTPASQEAMASIASRLKVLQKRCAAHFEEEEQELLPLLEAAEMRGEEQEEVLGRCLEEVMQSTHTNLIEFFMDGLTPREAVQYLWLVAKCCDRRWATALLQSLTAGRSEGSLLGLAWDPQKNT